MKSTFATLLSFLFYTNIFCCTCIGNASVKDEIKHSDVVFTGKVISVDTLIVRDSVLHWTSYNLRYKIQAHTIFKGKLKSKTIEVVTGYGHGDCGFPFEIGSMYVIYANYQNRYFANGGDKVSPFLSTNICRRTCLKTNSEIGEIKKYKKAVALSIS